MAGTETQTSSWPPAKGLATPLISRDSVVIANPASIRINAPATIILEVLRDASKYPEWNTWVPRMDITSQPTGTPAATSNADKDHLNVGTDFTMQVIMDASKPDKFTPTQLRITDISTPESPSTYVTRDLVESGVFTPEDGGQQVSRISWKTVGGFAAAGLKCERFHEIVVLRAEGDDCECEVRTWECMAGIFAHTVKWFYKARLQEAFQLWCRDLKKQSEKIAAASRQAQ